MVSTNNSRKKRPAKSIKRAKGRGIGINISTDSCLEIVEFNSDLNKIVNYIKADLPYDPILREINPESLEEAIQTALQRFDISNQMPVMLALPSIFINKKALPEELENDEISTALVSEAEKNYIFKKMEPAVCWNIISKDTDNQLNIALYAAMQKELITQIENVFKRQGLKLVGIDNSYAAFIRGLSTTGLVDEQIKSNLFWHVLLVKHNTNAVITLQGGQILNISETPLALNSLEKEDLYPSLSSSLLEKMQGVPVETVVIANYSSSIDVNNLMTYLNFKCPVIKTENNYFGREPLYKTSDKSSPEVVSPEAVGASLYRNAPVDFSFNFLQVPGFYEEVPDFLANIGVTGNPVHLLLIALITGVAALIAFFSIISVPMNNFFEKEYKQAYILCDKYKKTLNKPRARVFDLGDVVEKAIDRNEKIVSSYDSIGAVIPEKVWITSINISENLQTDISGNAYSVEDIITYYKNLLSISKFNNLKIKSIRVVGDSSSSEQDIPEITINNEELNRPVSRSNRNSMLPPPPPSPAAIAPVQPVSAVKYYEFSFGNNSSASTKTAGKKKKKR